MGWWSATVLGGDGPLDWHGDLCDVMGVEMTDEGEGYYGYAYTRELVEKHMGAMMNKVESETWEPAIGWQVLGAIVLKVGATIPDGLKVAVIQATKDDEWAKEGDAERIRWMDELAQAIEKAPPGKRIDLSQEGLLGQILKKIQPDLAQPEN